jgi:hypothetical protein
MRTPINGKDFAFTSAFIGAAVQAVPGELPMTLRLKNGDQLKGVATAINHSFEPSFGGVYVDRSPEDDPTAEPLEWTVTIGGRTILAQEIFEFAVALGSTG